jgi:hypothetical protein
MERRHVDATMAERNRELLEQVEVELVERGSQVFKLRRLPDVRPPDPRLEPRQVLPRANSFRVIA